MCNVCIYTEEENKRLQVELESSASDFNQVGFNYDAVAAPQPVLQQRQPYPYTQQQHQQQHPQQGYTPQADDDTFIPPSTLILPPGMTIVSTVNLVFGVSLEKYKGKPYYLISFILWGKSNGKLYYLISIILLLSDASSLFSILTPKVFILYLLIMIVVVFLTAENH